jgi:eukaryotic-like serine/threonine-protein kinase
MGSPLSPGTKLGRYQIRSPLGAGGMGEVYLAQDTHLNRKVALKVLPSDLINDRQRLLRFEREAQAASALNHPNILTIHEIGVEGNTHFIATEFIEGETLRHKLQTMRLEIKETLTIATQIAAALDEAHRHGIVHRDIKPENLILREDGLVKVLDFGLAKLTEQSEVALAATEDPTRELMRTTPGAVIGTVAYMSPEQARGREVDARTDIFSLGAVLYEMLTGRLPFAGETPSDMIAAILKVEPAPLNAHTPLELQRIVRKSLQKNADERYQTAKDLLIDLKALKEEQDFTAALERSGTFTKSDESAPTQDQSTHTVSSAEFIASGIKQHKTSFALTLIVLLLATLVFGYWFFTRRSISTAQIESIAVLPFQNESVNPDVDYLSDGMTESLINSLSQLPKLNVKARSSVFRYKGKEVEPQQVGSELNVQAILNGRVVQRGDDLTLYLSLVDGRNGNQIWGEQYNRKLTNLVTLQNEIARDVANKLRTRLSGADEQKLAKNYTENVEAYQLYLKGRFYWNKRTPDALERAVEYFKRAIALDPGYALAYAGLADAYALNFEYASLPHREAIPQARDAALKALSFDDGLAEAHASLGLILHWGDYDFAGAEREFKRAIELNPNYASAHQWYGSLLTSLGRTEEALVEHRRAVEIEPLSLVMNYTYAASLFFARRYDEAIAQAKKTLELDMNSLGAYFWLGSAFVSKGDYASAVDAFAKSRELSGDPASAEVMRKNFAKGGWQMFLRGVLKDGATVVSPYRLAQVHLLLGNKDEAFAQLNKSYDIREPALTRLKVDPRFDPLRDDPRFADLLRRMNLGPEVVR